MNVSDINIQTSSFKHLVNRTNELEPYIFNFKFRLFASVRDQYSWVYGLSEVEVSDYLQLYNSTKIELKNLINREVHDKLKSKLLFEYNNLPNVSKIEFNSHKGLILIPFIKISKTAKFKSMMREVVISFDNVINLLENKAWLEL